VWQSRNYAKKREKKIAYQARYQVEHHVAILLRQRRYRVANRRFIVLRNRSYYLAHKEEFFAAARNRAAMKRGAVDRLTAAQWREIVEFFDYRCAYCLQRLPLTQDHVIALSRGGTHTAENVVPACLPHNLEKSTKPVFFMTQAA
jgi:5-methylcytosine-specific restriction endonuclease McrA